ncbi:phosphotransferase enzyme family protein [Aspergillus uvarum CBS 121591]|uniref:Altered inheritance of mitochondria protein 9, mitochondrial n=1 Tax=Aspergillus uvarum CBS 121591 TaxID=1448315 RepID=A0A319E2J2_9EURO|nr:phosphotransferase enzyme family protein [Aspergillus uvarum CBS 121591]PYH85352.1 phosphotransferase enzyme family protein [Aspergillus uvarum CBS 121591]
MNGCPSNRAYTQTGKGGLDERIPEDDLYRYTRHRWLFNEPRELSKRYLKFNLRQLIDVAVNARNGARYCTKVVKCLEGLHNKAFLLVMDNGAEVVAKLPSPNAGFARYITASEVATRQLLREHFNIPTPRILAWSSDAANTPVKAEYIIEEKAASVRLGSLWNQWSRETKLKLVEQVVDMENKLTSTTFSKHGCVYFKADHRSLTGQVEDLNDDSSADEVLKRFTIGPLTSPELWTGTRSDMELDRGPWRNSSVYTHAMGCNETSWINAHARPRYIKVAPFLVPSSTDEAANPKVLWHPDLHLDNVFQSACVAPLFYQSHVPRMFRHHGPVQEGWAVPERPDNFDTLSAKDQEKITSDHEGQIIHKYYEALVYKRAPRHWAVFEQKNIPIVRKPAWLVTGVWENKDLFFLRQSLLSLVNLWEDLFQLPCPIAFTEKEIELHAEEKTNMDGIGQVLTLFRNQGVLPVDGMVDPKDYDVAVENSWQFKQVFLRSAENDKERELYSKLWPCQDTEDSVV